MTEHPTAVSASSPWSVVEETAMRRALDLAATPGLPLGPNPRVGCVLLHPDGTTIAEGFHRGAGTAHAEADALGRAGTAATGATAVVTLEPCNHTGRTGPCAQALRAAGVARVVYAMADPNPTASGGAETLRAAGVRVEDGLLEQEARALNRAWLFAVAHTRPLVTWKFAGSLDGRSAAADGSSRWISNRAARLDTHRLRAQADTTLVGTGTVLADDPQLTLRDERGWAAAHQGLRAVMGQSDLPPAARVLDDAAPTVHLRTRNPRQALQALHDRGQRHVFLEGGPRLAASFLKAGLVDEIVAYVAPVLLGAGRSAVSDLAITDIGHAPRPAVTDITILHSPGEQPNVRLTLTTGEPTTG